VEILDDVEVLDIRRWNYKLDQLRTGANQVNIQIRIFVSKYEGNIFTILVDS
jgi:hypothetical protein